MTGPDAPAPETPPTPARETPVRRGAPLWMRLLLFASLALNLLVVGIVVGAIASRRAPDSVAPPRDPASALYFRALPGDHRDAFEAGLRRDRERFGIDREALNAEVAATLQVLRADPFEPAALAERIALQRRGLADRTAAGDRLLVERVAAMTPEEREAYADRLEQILGQVARWRGH
ncbi:MAG: periplasmic heavy metal sensor [Paracoccaceae bacterium]|nr:periplasmic heavy metal sensor [Paracoccaceae bacterium]